MKQVVSAGLVIYRIHHGEVEYLLLHYRSGHWDLPKGKMEPGETKQQTALRELHEETGLVAEIQEGFEEFFDYTFKDFDGLQTRKTVYFFVGKAHPGTIKLSHEHKNFVWLSYNQALERVTFENAKELLKKADVFIRNEK